MSNPVLDDLMEVFRLFAREDNEFRRAAHYRDLGPYPDDARSVFDRRNEIPPPPLLPMTLTSDMFMETGPPPLPRDLHMQRNYDADFARAYGQAFHQPPPDPLEPDYLTATRELTALEEEQAQTLIELWPKHGVLPMYGSYDYTDDQGQRYACLRGIHWIDTKTTRFSSQDMKEARYALYEIGYEHANRNPTLLSLDLNSYQPDERSLIKVGEAVAQRVTPHAVHRHQLEAQEYERQARPRLVRRRRLA